MPKKSPRIVAAVMLTILALLLSAPIVDYALSPRGDWLNPLGFREWTDVPAVAWVSAIATGIFFAAFSIRGIPAVRATWREFSWLKFISLWAAAGAAVVEEALFRRVIMDGVAGLGGNHLLQVLASALGFGLAHAVWGLIKLDPWVAVSSVVATTIMGLGLAVVYLLADRNLAPCIVGHFLITGAIEPGLMIAAVTGRWDRKVSPTMEAAGTSTG